MSNRAIKYRVYPTTEQAVMFAKAFGCSRKVYNLMLSDKIKGYEATGKFPEQILRESGQVVPSSQICHKCGIRHREMKDLGRRTIRCKCGLVMDRDLNAAINIRNEGLRILKETI